jgi:hypothetical protein
MPIHTLYMLWVVTLADADVASSRLYGATSLLALTRDYHLT